MRPLLLHAWRSLIDDEVAVRRWLRASLMAFAAGGVGFADHLSLLFGVQTKHVKIAAVVAGIVSSAINLGQKNPTQPAVGSGAPPC